MIVFGVDTHHFFASMAGKAPIAHIDVTTPPIASLAPEI